MNKKISMIDIRIGNDSGYLQSIIHVVPCNAKLEDVIKLMNKIVNFATAEALKTQSKDIVEKEFDRWKEDDLNIREAAKKEAAVEKYQAEIKKKMKAKK